MGNTIIILYSDNYYIQWVKLKFTPERARWVASEKWHPKQKGEFLEKDNIVYEPIYNSRETKRYFHTENDVTKTYVVEEYSINKIINEGTFYGIYDFIERNPNKTYFMSRNGFLKLLSDNPNMYEEGNEPKPDERRTLKNKPETDINEFKRRY